MEEEHLDYVLVPLGLLVFGLYNVWLLFTILRFPRRTVIGINAESRHQWVFSMMSDPLKNGVLSVQTIRNNIMASTLLATTAITLSSLISVFVSSTSKSSDTSSQLVYGNKTSILSSIKGMIGVTSIRSSNSNTPACQNGFFEGIFVFLLSLKGSCYFLQKISSLMTSVVPP